MGYVGNMTKSGLGYSERDIQTDSEIDIDRIFRDLIQPEWFFPPTKCTSETVCEAQIINSF